MALDVASALDIVHMMMSDIRLRGQEQVQGPGEPGPGPGEREHWSVPPGTPAPV